MKPKRWLTWWDQLRINDLILSFMFFFGRCRILIHSQIISFLPKENKTYSSKRHSTFWSIFQLLPGTVKACMKQSSDCIMDQHLFLPFLKKADIKSVPVKEWKPIRASLWFSSISKLLSHMDLGWLPLP